MKSALAQFSLVRRNLTKTPLPKKKKFGETSLITPDYQPVAFIMATSSRIFIRNLPPSLSDSEFRSHFSRGQQQDITDARFFPNRRIGYVGYKSTDDAAAAVKYFNKSFIRMSRIAVELANPYAESETPKQKLGTKTQNTEIPDDQRDNPLKRKREDENKIVKKGSELTEFLKVMRAPNKTRTWQNEVTDGVENVVEQPTKDDDASDDDIQVISASQKSQFTQNQDNGDEGDWDTKAAEEGKIIHNFEQSDDAWLRSRTTGLVDGSKIAQEENEDDEDKQEPIEGSVSNQTNSKASSAPMEGDGKQSKESITEPITPEDKIREHGRLYVRNLPFKTTEDDLRKHFSSFGSLDEVSLDFFYHEVCYHDET
jgi:multiple RNA-binding domain-containing protein 1